ncbi:MAG TPA: META domain-containing protein [Sulfurovum sp.]|uniref:META domain-containing protein n=1 Tax=Sulfurovum sp. TaxID=1969726 RepID=UPI002F92CA86
MFTKMLSQKTVMLTLLVSLSTTYLSAQTQNVDLDDLQGNWHLRTMDGKDVRKARAILDFDAEHNRINGFDGCNPVLGELKTDDKSMLYTKLSAKSMACRQSIHQYVRTRLHTTMKEGFTVTKTTKDGMEGITIRSSKHELFFKKMGQGKEKKWF